MEKTNNKLKLIKIILVIIVVLYFVFLYMDLFNVQFIIPSNIIKFVSMILIFIIALTTGRDALYSKDVFLLKIGLLITLIADVFLLLCDDYLIIGIGLFCIVQILYSIRYKSKDAKIIIRNFIIIFILLGLGYIFINKFIIEIDFLIVIALYYSICLLSSTSKAIQVYKYKLYPKLNSKMIALGMVLFLLCDINVALYNILESVIITNRFAIVLINLSFISMWFFYLPSQILLSLSGYSSDFLKNIFSK